MTVFWAVLAVTVLACLAAAGALVRSVRRHPSWHPGDGLPHIPEDAPIRRQRG